MATSRNFIFCKRLQYIFSALDNARSRKGAKELAPVNSFDEDGELTELLDSFISLRWARPWPDESWSSRAFKKMVSSTIQEQGYVYRPLPDLPEDFETWNLVVILTRLDWFARQSIRGLQHFRDVPTGIYRKNPPSHFILNWLRHANLMLLTLWHNFHENEELRQAVIHQKVVLPEALGRFLRLLAMVHASHKEWKNAPGAGELWAWPTQATPGCYAEDGWPGNMEKFDLVEELESVQQLFALQNHKRRDHKLRNNFGEAKKFLIYALDSFPKTIVVHLCLRYSVEHVVPVGNPAGKKTGTRPAVDLETFVDQLEGYCRKVNRKPGALLPGLYMAQLQYGLRRGHHAHVLLFINGLRFCHGEEALVRTAMELWTHNVAPGVGSAWSINTIPGHPHKGATGTYRRNHDEEKISCLVHLIEHLVRFDLPFDYVGESKVKRFRKSKMTKPR